MMIVYATNNRNGLNVLKELKNMKVDIEYLIVHPKDKGKYVEEIARASEIGRERIFYWDERKLDDLKAMLFTKSSEVLFSVNFGYIIPKEILNMFELPLNLHMSYLPYNKGRHPNVWSIVERTPAGVTIHRMTEKIDGGEIYAQMKVEVEPWDTGKSLYEKLEKASIELVKNTFMDVIQGRVKPKKNEGGTFHYSKDFKEICKIELEKQYKARELIDILRALTFPPYKNAYFEANGERVFIELKLYPDKRER